MHPRKFWILLLLLISAIAMAHADIGLVLEQPIGRLGQLTGAGHVSIYLSRVCAASPDQPASMHA